MTWQYFSYGTDPMLACPCCGEKGMDDTFMREILDPIRNACGFPFHITSGYRCPEYNNRISSTGTKGAHTTGKAVDIRANSRQKSQIMSAAYNLGISRFGVAKTFVHLDDCAEDEGFDSDVVWTY